MAKSHDLKRDGSNFFISSCFNSFPCNSHVEVEQTGINEVMTARFEKREPTIFFLMFLNDFGVRDLKCCISNCNFSLSEHSPRYVL